MTLQQASITLRQLLTMTAGFSSDGGLNLTAGDPVAQILSLGMINDPGVALEYSNVSAHLVAAVLRNAVDRPILDYAREKLFEPLGIDSRPAFILDRAAAVPARSRALLAAAPPRRRYGRHE
jgi:CubicO group peptidase (beta-lactamase class C family)